MAIVVQLQELERLSLESIDNKVQAIVENINNKLRLAARNFERTLDISVNEIVSILFSQEVLPTIREKLIRLYNNPDPTDRLFINISQIYTTIFNLFTSGGYRIEVNRNGGYENLSFRLFW